MGKKLDHVSVIVKDIDAALTRYCDMLGLNRSETAIVDLSEELGLKTAVVPMGKNFIELLQVTGPAPEPRRWLDAVKKQGTGAFHISVFTEDYDKEVKQLKEKGCPVEENVLSKLFPGFKVRLSFVPPEWAEGVWIELVDVTSLPPQVRDNI